MSTTLHTRRFDAAEFLDSDAMVATFLADALSSGDIRVFQEALQAAARARGMAAIAEASGLGRESLYKALRPDAQPRFDTVRRVLEALGVTLSFSAIAAPAPRANSVHEPRARYDVTAGQRGKAAPPGKAPRPGRATGAGKPGAKQVVAPKRKQAKPVAKAPAKKTARTKAAPSRKKAAKR